MDRLNAAASIGGSSGKYGAQQRFSASTRSPMSSVRQNLYALMRASHRSGGTRPSAERATVYWSPRGEAPRTLMLLAHRDRADLVQVGTAGALVVGGDHLGHHLLADLDPVLDEGEINRGGSTLSRQLFDALLRLVPHEASWNAEDPLCSVVRPVERGDQRILLVVARDQPGLAGTGGGGLGDFGGASLDVQRRAGLFLDDLPREVERDRVQLHHAGALLDACLDPAALVGVLHGPQAFARVLGPAELPAVVGGLLLESSLYRGDLFDHLLLDHVEIGGAADGARDGAALRGGDAARA